MKPCEKCGSKSMNRIDLKTLDEETGDNIIEVYKCEDCGHEEIQINHIG